MYVLLTQIKNDRFLTYVSVSARIFLLDNISRMSVSKCDDYTEISRGTAHVARNRPPPNFRFFKFKSKKSYHKEIDDDFNENLEIFEHLL